MNFRFNFKKPAMMLAVCVFFSSLPSRAGIEQDMAGMFDSMGMETNYTRSGSFHGQAGDLYSGGSLSVRAPVSNLNLANLQLPHIEAGCGGIDFFGGSFSFVNKEQFIQFTRNLGNNAAGVAFDLALKALDPMIGGAIQTIRDLVTEINQTNLNSCQAAKQLVGGAMGQLGSSLSNNCKAGATRSGAGDDYSESSWLCQFGNNLVNQSNQAKGSNTPEDVISFTGGNLTYEAIKRTYPDLSNNDNETDLLISLVGTVVFHPPKEGSSKDIIEYGMKAYPPKILRAEDLMSGKAAKNGRQEKILIDIWRCRDGSARLRENCVEVRDYQITSIRHQVKTALKNLVDNIPIDGTVTAADRQMTARLSNNSRYPIIKMLIADAFMGTNLLGTDAMIDAITIDYIAHIVDKLGRNLRASLSRFDKLDEASQKQRDLLLDNLRELRNNLAAEQRDALKRVTDERVFVEALRTYDDIWRQQQVDLNNSANFDAVNSLN